MMFNLVPRTRFERVTLGLEVLCSIQLSYRGIVRLYQSKWAKPRFDPFTLVRVARV